MSKETLVLVLGIAVFFTPFIGLPREYKDWILIVSGIVLMLIGYRLRRQVFLDSLTHESGERRADGFVESTYVNQSESNDGVHTEKRENI